MSETLDLTRALVAQNTIDPPGNERLTAMIVAEKLRAEGIEPLVYEVAPGRTNLVARIPGTGEKPGLAFSAHFRLPDCGVSSFISSFSSVVLPTPFSPITATFSPALMVSVSRLNSLRSPCG